MKYEKLPIFCDNCGMMGHWHEECGDGVYDVSTLEWGDFILADGGRGRGRGRNPNRASSGGKAPGGQGRGNKGDGWPEDGGLGRGRQQAHMYADSRETDRKHDDKSKKDVQPGSNALVNNSEKGDGATAATSTLQVTRVGDQNILGKRSAEDTEPLLARTLGGPTDTVVTCGALVPVGNMALMVDQFDRGLEKNAGQVGIPQRNQNKKILKGNDGAAIDSTS